MIEKPVTGIYIRVSTEEQAKDGFSINAQKEKLTKYAELNDWNIYDYYIDDGISGKNLVERKEVTRLINDIKNKKINNILIYKLDRLTRSLKDLIYLIELFEKYNCTFNSQTEKIDTSNAVGRMFVKIIGIFAEFERENLAERVSFGYEQKTREGNYTNCNGVYGYDYIVGEQRLAINEKERKIVNRIYDLYISGESYLKIANSFNKENVKTKRGGHWASSTIKSIINNPLYIGKIRYGLSKKNKVRSFTVDGNNIEPIISVDKWNRANSIARVREHCNIRRYPSENSYFFHTIKCGICKSKIFAKQQKHNNYLYITYKCSNKFCNSSGFSHNKMEKVFLNYLDTLGCLKPSELETNIKSNWEYLTNKEKQLFLERFVKVIEVYKLEDKIIINKVEYN